MELLNHSGNTGKKYPMYYLELEAHQNRNLLKEKNINKFVDNATKNIDISERLAMYTILKYVILNTGYEKQDIINKTSQMFNNEKIRPIINASPLNKQALQKFKSMDEDGRKVVIKELIDSLNKLDFNMLKNEKNNEIYINKDITKVIEKKEKIYIEYDYNDKNKRLLYIYEDGTIIVINVKKHQCASRIKKVNVENIKFLIEFLKNDIFDLKNDKDTIIISVNRKTILKNKYMFYIILLLLKEKKKLQDKIFFDYEYYFNITLKREMCMLHKEQREDLFIFDEWCPDEIEIPNIVEDCKNITSKINIEVNDKDVTELYYFANYYKKNKDYIKSIQFFEKIAQNGIDYANGEIAFIYNQMKNKQMEEEYLGKINDLINIYKNLTAKKCYEIHISENEEISNAIDSSMYGKPYLPIGEKYPYSKDGKPLKMLIQVNMKDINLEKYPKTGVLQIYVKPNSRNPESQIRYYNDLFLPYQTELPETEELDLWNYAPNNVKISLKESITYMPLIDKGIESAIKRTIKEYNKLIGINLLKYDIDDLDILWYLIEKKIEIYPLLLGGYADYCNTDFYASKNKECLLKLMSNSKNGDNFSINVLISSKEMENRDFDKAEIIFED